MRFWGFHFYIHYVLIHAENQAGFASASEGQNKLPTGVLNKRLISYMAGSLSSTSKKLKMGAKNLGVDSLTNFEPTLWGDIPFLFSKSVILGGLSQKVPKLAKTRDFRVLAAKNACF